jgi:hypothetical protein
MMNRDEFVLILGLLVLTAAMFTIALYVSHYVEDGWVESVVVDAGKEVKSVMIKIGEE